ncbi:hypothetical protein [Noviherbaspirillum massiliense]|uniref:hypothetical protein n=1 Tax=Noviherbaspirillum massiliense TaxID=1465823 RepID=UPI00036B2E89|nr:hypothetical protein [Noviherbaspirillum massiliense]
MKNPWTRKNPFLSMWLSSANAVFGTARGKAMAEGKRQTAAVIRKGTKRLTDFWIAEPQAPLPKRRKKRR